jgi:isoleucyl-tRNA synthetase
MAKFNELPGDINYSSLEADVQSFWKQHNIFEKSISSRQEGKTYTFYEGPPTVNGKPGVHHVFSRTIKDLVCRYKTMKGFKVSRKAGWDTHGLPVEISVEKKLGLKNKSQVEGYGVEEFNKEAKSLVYQNIEDSKDGWGRLTEMMGYWVDMDDPYITCTNNYIESVWWGLKQIFDKGLIYKDYKIVPQDPRSETVLSSHELALGYKEVKDPSVYVKLKRKDKDESFLVWTTTPWTLISNVALCVGPNVEYVRVKTKDHGVLVLAKSRLSVLGKPSEDNPVEVLESIKGSELEKTEYEPLFTYVPVEKKAFYITLGDFVSTEDGTGIVHIAPAFGADDYEISKKYNLPMLQPVKRDGHFTEEVSDYKGVFFKDADKDIIIDLKQRGRLYKKETITHTYPFSWRYDVPVLYYARESWYIRTTEVASKMIAINKEINWCPPEIGSGRFGNWLEENKDWAISRERFWGTPLPVWVSEDFKTGDTHKSGTMFAIGSLDELKTGFIDIDGTQYKLSEALDKDLVELDLHKPFVDRIYFVKDGKTFRRTPELIDVWFDSGAMPFAQLHYPFENKDAFQDGFPADFIAEGVDQTRGWFYTLHAISTLIFNQPAYKNLIVNGHILDKQGQKMSKSKGNVVNPFEMMETYGADSLRWYLISSTPPWRPKSFNPDELVEGQRKFFRALINSYNFFVLYANVDEFEFSQAPIPMSDRSELDRWIISALYTLVKSVEEAMDDYDPTLATRLIEAFVVDDLSNWYIRRSRRRFWKSESSADKLEAYQTLYQCLVTLCKLIAPFSPFISDSIYRSLNSVTGKESYESVHLAFFPAVEETAVDADLELRMKKAQIISSLVRTMREKASIKVRQPLKRILLPIWDPKDRREIEKVRSIILDEVNVHDIEYVDDDSGIVNKKAKPNFKVLGPRFGKQVNPVANKIRELGTKEVSELELKGILAIEVNNETIEITLQEVDVLHEDLEGWLVESDEASKIMVALDTEIDETLKAEGLARELVSRIQAVRKETGLDITDRIKLYVDTTQILENAIKANSDYIMTETLATEIGYEFNGNGLVPKTEVINGEICRLAIEKK